MSNRITAKAVLTIVLGIGFMTLFLWKAGMAIWVSLSFFLLYYLVSLGLTRFRAEMGVPMHDFHFTGPDQMLPDVFGARRIGYRNLTVMSMLGFFNFTYRGHPQPHQMEGLALLDRAGVGSKRIFLAMTAALVVGTLSLFWVYLHVAYTSGGSSLQRFADVIYTRVADWIAYPSKKIEISGIQTPRHWFQRFNLSDCHASATPLVAAAPGRVCDSKQPRHQPLLVLHVYRFCDEVVADKVRRGWTIPPRATFILGTHFGRIRRREHLDDNR